MEKVNRKESAFKSILWRIIGVITLFAVTYFYTKRWVVTTKITFIHHSVFLVVFYLYERIWLRIKNITGKKRNIIKGLIYELVLGMGGGGLIVFSILGSFPMVTKITGTYTVIKIIMYYFYDRLFSEIRRK